MQGLIITCMPRSVCKNIDDHCEGSKIGFAEFVASEHLFHLPKVRPFFLFVESVPAECYMSPATANQSQHLYHM